MQFFEEYVEVDDDRRDDMIDFLVTQVEKTGLFAPVLFFLETGTPLSFVFSQLMYGGAPFADVILQNGQHTLQDYAQIFEDRKNLYLLIEALEKRQEEFIEQQEKDKLRRKRQKQKEREEREKLGEETGLKKWLKFPRKK